MSKSLIVLFTLAAFSRVVIAQKDESVVAQIGNEKITTKDFKLRIELSPYIPAKKGIDQLSEREFKNDFLYSLIAEKLWALEAERLGFSSIEKFRFYFKPLEDMFVRDALFKQEVDDKVKVSANDINAGIQKSQIKLSTQIISTNDSLQIHNFYSQLSTHYDFDSVLSTFPTLTSTDADVFLGSLRDEKIEDSLYSLEINQLSSPIKSEVGWIIFKIKNKVFSPIDLKDQKAIENMKKVIRDRRIEKRYHDYLTELLSGIKININPEAFITTFTEIWSQLKNKTNVSDSINFYEITETDFDLIIKSLTNSDLNQTLFNLDEKIISIKYFLSELAFRGFNVNRLDSIFVLQKLNQRVKQFVEDQVITQEGYKRELHLKPEVRNDLSLWRQNYLAQFFSNSILDSITVTESEIYDYYTEELVNATSIRLINLRLVTLKDLEEVSKVFDLLKEGINFSDIIKGYGKTDSLVNNEGETGLRPVLLLGDVGKIASDLKLDEVYGPIQRNNAYSIIQVTERKDSDDSLKLSFESIKNELRNDLRFNKQSERLKNITSNLAEKNNVKIYNDVLDKIQTTKIPMFLHRFMGFGGRIAGVPLLTPFSDWMDNTVRKKLLP